MKVRILMDIKTNGSRLVMKSENNGFYYVYCYRGRSLCSTGEFSNYHSACLALAEKMNFYSPFLGEFRYKPC